MDDIDLSNLLHADPLLRLSVFSATSTSRKGDLAVKQYLCNSAQEIDELLSEAIAQAREPFPAWAALVEVRLTQQQDCFTVNFIIEKFERELYREVMCRNDRSGKGAQDLGKYEVRKEIYEKPGEIAVRVKEAWATALGCEVVLKTYEPIYSIDRANPMIKEAFVQAHVSHKHNCRLIEVVFCKAAVGRAFTLHLVMEKLSKDVSVEIAERRAENRAFSEAELVAFLKQVVAGLLQAKLKRIAHRDIKPANIFLSDSEGYKVGDFGSSWEKARRVAVTPVDVGCVSELESLTASAGGTVPYLSPEMRESMLGMEVDVNSFESDIYSLGVTVLHLGQLEYPRSLNTTNEAQLRDSIPREVNSLQCSHGLKRLIISMLSLDPRQRPILEAISVELDGRLEASELVQTRSWDHMTSEELAIAERQLKNSIEALENSPDRDDKYLADTCSSTAWMYISKGDYSRAEKFALRSLKIYEGLIEDSSSKIANIHRCLSSIYRNLGRYAESESFIVKSVEINSRLFGENSAEMGVCLRELYTIYEVAGRHQEAEAVALKTLRIRKELFGDEDIATLSVYSELALIYLNLGRLEEAETISLEVIQTLQKNVEKEDASPHSTLGQVYFLMGRFSEAKAQTLIALKLITDATGENLNSSKIYINLSAICRDTASLEEAEMYARKCLSIQQQALGEDHPELASTYLSLAAIYQSMGNLKDAVLFNEKCLQLRKKCFGENHPNSAVVYNNFACIYQETGRLEEAEQCALKCMEIESMSLKDDDLNKSNIYRIASNIYRLKKDYLKAEKFGLQGYHLEKSFPNHPHLPLTCNNLAMLYQSMHRWADSEKFARENVSILQNRLGDEHPTTIDAYKALGCLFYSCGKQLEAGMCLLFCGDMLPEPMRSDVPMRAVAFREMANKFLDAGKLSDAEVLARKSLSLLVGSLGEQHPHLANTHCVLFSIYKKSGNLHAAEESIRKAIGLIEAIDGVDPFILADYRRNFEEIVNQQAGKKPASKRKSRTKRR